MNILYIYIYIFVNNVSVIKTKIISGMTESIVAAAASRIGKRVLHLDR